MIIPYYFSKLYGSIYLHWQYSTSSEVLFLDLVFLHMHCTGDLGNLRLLKFVLSSFKLPE